MHSGTQQTQGWWVYDTWDALVPGESHGQTCLVLATWTKVLGLLLKEVSHTLQPSLRWLLFSQHHPTRALSIIPGFGQAPITIHKHARTHTHTHYYTHIPITIHTHTHVPIATQMHTHVPITHTHTHTNTHTHYYTHILITTHTYTCTHYYTDAHTYLLLHTHTLSHIHKHTHMHTCHLQPVPGPSLDPSGSWPLSLMA